MKEFLKWLGRIILVLAGIFVLVILVTQIMAIVAVKKTLSNLPQIQQQISQSVDNQRKQDVINIANAVKQNLINNKGKLDCAPVGSTNKEYKTLPINNALIIGRTATNGFNLEPCIVPYYISKMPTDPAGGTLDNTGYVLQYDPNSKIVEVISTRSYSGAKISASATVNY